MLWFKILFAQGDPQFLKVVNQCCQRVGSKDFAIYGGAEFSDDDRVGYDVLYFSTPAALACESITKSFTLLQSEPPDLNSEFVKFWCGTALLSRH